MYSQYYELELFEFIKIIALDFLRIKMSIKF